MSGGAAGAAVTLSTPSAPSGHQSTRSGVPSGPAGSRAHTERPLLAVVGASFAAGVGAGTPDHAWPEDLARTMHWRLALQADPGAGYVNPGSRHRGPFAKLASHLHLARIDPDTIIIQGGHDDIGRPLPLIRARVERLIATIRREAPHARLAVLTVFARGRPTPATVATDQAIVAAARHADPAVLVFDPIASHWQFPRIGDHLHPTPAGHEWIARKLAGGLRGHGVLDRLSGPSGPDAESRLNAQPRLG
ncbi:MAG TPA: SGNH/GDSL hydrolase family protein [Streptosporangiaceae bacterium]|nr:SGNH/GDSL hydrolase family protein [Streptosporangiaceae bacterium]